MKIPTKTFILGVHTHTLRERERQTETDRETERQRQRSYIVERQRSREIGRLERPLHEGVYQATLARRRWTFLCVLWHTGNRAMLLRALQCCCKSRSVTMLDEEADADLDNAASFERPQEFPTVPPEELALTFRKQNQT